MSAFVLVHGAWHGAWCWSEVVPILEEMGHTVEALDLPSHGDDPTPPGEVGWDEYTAYVGKALARAGEPAILVGHSMGGAVISRVAERFPARIRSLVYLAAFLVTPDSRIERRPSALDGHIQFGETEALLDSACVREALYGDCTDEQVARATRLLSPNPVKPLLDISAGSPLIAGIPRRYVECLQDRALPIEQQREMIALAGCDSVHSLAASHSPFFSMPAELATLLDEISQT